MPFIIYLQSINYEIISSFKGSKKIFNHIILLCYKITKHTVDLLYNNIIKTQYFSWISTYVLITQYLFVIGILIHDTS